MEEGRVYTHGTLRAARRRSEHAGTAKLRGCQVRTTFRRFGNVASGRFWHVQRAPACRYALWRRAPLLGPPPWPPMVPTSAARRPIALRREPTVARGAAWPPSRTLRPHRKASMSCSSDPSGCSKTSFERYRSATHTPIAPCTATKAALCHRRPKKQTCEQSWMSVRSRRPVRKRF